MNDLQFQILDELYFVSSFAEVAEATGLQAETLRQELAVLAGQGYVRICYPDPDTELAYDPAAFAAQADSYYFLASKAGLLAHNSR